ncbi:MAG TPA: GNAT family N-acetyltransferase [Edaphobacter sp.]|jgi:GNAT superfamily N-acetyltransferase|nr:GNAT family N-acetyltransferase [Edaphobacter sp.]
MIGVDEFTVRRASVEDAMTIAAHRRAMFLDMGSAGEEALDEMAARFIPWVNQKLAAEEYLEWFAVAVDGSVAAGVGLWLIEWPPHHIGGAPRRGYLMNVYTEKRFRRLGLAGHLMESAMDWCRSHGIEVIVLHASNRARPLYEAMGFAATNEMRMVL